MRIHSAIPSVLLAGMLSAPGCAEGAAGSGRSEQESTDRPAPTSGQQQGATKSPEVPAMETRVHAKEWIIDRSAFVGLSPDGAEDATRAIRAAIDAVDGTPPRRRTFRRIEADSQPRYPLDVAWEPAGDEPVAVLLLPRPTAVRSVLERTAGPEVQAAAVQGRTLFFAPGIRSEAPVHVPALPRDATLSAGIFKYNPPHLKLGKLVLGGRDSDDPAKEPLDSLRLGGFGGASVSGWLRSAPIDPANPVLRRVRLEQPGAAAKEWVAFAVADANGARRGNAFVTPSGSSAFANGLVSADHDPRLGAHSLLRIPGPIALGTFEQPREEIALDEWFASAEPPIYALVRASSSTPFRDDFVLLHLKGAIEPEALLGGEILQIIVFDGVRSEDLSAVLQSLAVPRR